MMYTKDKKKLYFNQHMYTHTNTTTQIHTYIHMFSYVYDKNKVKNALTNDIHKYNVPPVTMIYLLNGPPLKE